MVTYMTTSLIRNASSVCRKQNIRYNNNFRYDHEKRILENILFTEWILTTKSYKKYNVTFVGFSLALVRLTANVKSECSLHGGREALYISPKRTHYRNPPFGMIRFLRQKLNSSSRWTLIKARNC